MSRKSQQPEKKNTKIDKIHTAERDYNVEKWDSDRPLQFCQTGTWGSAYLT